MIEETKKRKIGFSPVDIRTEEIEAVVDVLRSGWITTGPKTKWFEKQLAGFLQLENQGIHPRVVALNSCTAAIELSLRILGIGQQNGGSLDDEVITCAYTYTASAEAAVHVGARVVLVDCCKKEDSLEMDYEALDRAITSRTKAIVPVDLAGIPCDYQRIYQIVHAHQSAFIPSSNALQQALSRIAVIADAAHALGAKRKDIMVGNLADFTCFSFHAVKNLTTAEGGAVSWRSIAGVDDDDLYQLFQWMSLHGQSKDALSKYTNQSNYANWEYDIRFAGYKCNMTDINAALGLSQLQRYNTILLRRRSIIERYDTAFRAIGIHTLRHYADAFQSAGHLYITRVPGIGYQQRQIIMNEMLERGISTNVHYKPLPLMSAYQDMGFDIERYPESYRRFENEITLPLNTCLTDLEVTYIIENYIDICKPKMEKG